jgi:hypothetical protein
MCRIRNQTYRQLVVMLLPVRTTRAVIPSILLSWHPYLLLTCSVQPTALFRRLLSLAYLNHNWTTQFVRILLNNENVPFLSGWVQFSNRFMSILRTALIVSRPRVVTDWAKLCKLTSSVVSACPVTKVTLLTNMPSTFVFVQVTKVVFLSLGEQSLLNWTVLSLLVQFNFRKSLRTKRHR